MAYRLWEIALGAVVMAAAVVFVVFALSATGTRLSESQGYALTATFRSAEGVRPGTDVRLAGVKIGTVSSLSLDPQSFRAQLSVTINNGIDLPRDSTIQIASEGILGGTFVEILPGGDMDNLAAGDQFQDTQSAVSLVTLLLRAFTGSDASAVAE
ncbi:outer membrane lipid asymmetry maintenance protein MlaD [Pararhodobacter zhoushanensis]|uniref:outer membrane lipid asymmetry maintenance protein MlaD n=1 Tax=Pararhodobacter zhoushanensis TaxID=2479545 RepID=UPI000F8D1A57|nr:outer membrane lipid asymmetry maintenance protein MlaD [Pararhodobacter zhoushanensis]